MTIASHTPFKVVLLESIHPSAFELFDAEGIEVIQHNKALPEDELITSLTDAQMVGIRSKSQITPRVISESKNLLAVGCFCIGTNQVALEDANGRGIPVFNAPFSNTRSVAELVLSEVVMLSRHLGDCCRELHEGLWNKAATGRHEVRGKTLGVVGYGHIGSQVGVLAEAFGLRVIFYDIAKRLPMGNNRAVDSFDELLREADFVTFHVPATAETSGMVQAEHLAMMRKGSYVINASRGSVINIDALAESIRKEHVAGAAIDVYPKEPRKNGKEFDSPLRGLPNVVLTPHIGGSTEEAQENIGREVASALIDFAKLGTTSTAVNFPQVDLRMRPGSHRILNAHANVPGVMADILDILSELNVNIHAQTLATDDKIGYLITDMDQSVSQDVRDAIASLPNSIRTRIVTGASS